jgi:mono/diheme cytochrome c family protein
MFDYIGVGVLVVLVLLLGWLTGRARRLRAAPLKWGGLVLGGLLTLTLTAVTGIVLVGYYRLNQAHSNPVPEIRVAATEAQLARGQQLARGCAGCHSASGDLPLTGQNFTAEGPPFGTLYAPNLTPAHLQDWSDGEIARAIREGVHKNDRSLVIMPSVAFHSMSDDDVQAIIAYLRSQPATGPESPPTRLNVMGALVAGLDPKLLSVQAPLNGPVVAPAAGVTPEYGQYLSTISGCIECHGTNLSGNPNGPEGPGPSLHPYTNQWSAEQFIQTIRTGVTPDGRALAPSMPWRDYELYSDDDLRAIHAYTVVQATQATAR